METCIFCKIVSKKIPSDFVFENEVFIAFKDISPQAPVHLLLLPKKHVETILDIGANDQKWWQQIPAIVKQLAQSTGVDKKGFRLVLNYGEEGGQAVPHVHFHLLGGRRLNWPPG